MIVEFETRVEDNIIHLPEEVAIQLQNGAAIHVSIRAVAEETGSMNPEEAWNTFLKTTADRKNLPVESTAYHWKREDAYEHLK